MLSIAILSFALTSTATFKTANVEEVVEEINIIPQLVEPISLQQVHQFQYLSNVSIMLPAEVKLQTKPEICDLIPTFGLRDDQAAISITGDSQSVSHVILDYDEGHLSIKSADLSKTSGLEITIYIDSLESIVLKRFDEASVLNLSLNQDEKTHIGLIDAASVNIAMQGHGLLEIDHLSSENVSLKMDGHGKIFLPQLNAKRVEVSMDGHGEIKFSGKVDSQAVHLLGHGFYDANGMTSKHASLFVRGHAKSKLLVREDLSLDVLELENVSYRGDAKVSRVSELPMLSAI